jgi:hypothetical protein
MLSKLLNLLIISDKNDVFSAIFTEGRAIV